MNQSLSYYVLVNGKAIGPLSGDRIVSATSEGDPLVCPVGQQQWVRASSVPELAAWLPPPPPPSSFRAQALGGHSSDDYLFFDPTQPRIVGLLVVYGLIVSPLLFLIGACSSFAELGNMGEIADTAAFLIIFWTVMLYLLGIAIALAVAALALRNRWRSRWGWAFGTYTVSVIGTVLLFLFILHGSMTSPDYAVGQAAPPVATVDLILGAIGAFVWCFELFAVIWLLANRRRFTSA